MLRRAILHDVSPLQSAGQEAHSGGVALQPLLADEVRRDVVRALPLRDVDAVARHCP
jgi:hypothetical protein